MQFLIILPKQLTPDSVVVRMHLVTFLKPEIEKRSSSGDDSRIISEKADN